jgi:hypothetical protein
MPDTGGEWVLRSGDFDPKGHAPTEPGFYWVRLDWKSSDDKWEIIRFDGELAWQTERECCLCLWDIDEWGERVTRKGKGHA